MECVGDLVYRPTGFLGSQLYSGEISEELYHGQFGFEYLGLFISPLNRILPKCNNRNKPRKGLSQPSNYTLP